MALRSALPSRSSPVASDELLAPYFAPVWSTLLFRIQRLGDPRVDSRSAARAG
jgi:hypothetical protein